MLTEPQEFALARHKPLKRPLQPRHERSGTLTLSDFLDTAGASQTLREAMHDWVHYVRTGEIR
jgi:hypothetical protein